MNPPIRSLIVIALSAIVSYQTYAEPMDFREVSLWVRAHQPESEIVQEVSQRKLLRTLNADQEATLKKQGALDSLVQTLRRSDLTLAPADATAFETRREQMQKARATAAAAAEEAQANEPHVHIMNVAFGQMLNLSQWGGLDYEIAFYNYRFAGEDHIEPVMIDNVRSVTEVSRPIRFTSEDEAFARDFFLTNSVRNQRFTPYDTRIDERDNRLANNNDTVTVRSNSASRRLMIDWQNPTYLPGQPYAFYPVYGAGAASLYYIGKANDRTARVAVVARR